jgi:hypothetical protein
MRAFISLVDQRGGNQALLADIGSFMKDADDLGRRRNRIIHDPWVAGEELGTAFRLEIQADRKLQFRWKPVSTPKIDQLAGDVLLAKARFLALYERALAELPPFPQTQFEQSHEIPMGQP